MMNYNFGRCNSYIQMQKKSLFYIAATLFLSAAFFTGCSSPPSPDTEGANENILKDAENFKDDSKGIGPIKSIQLDEKINDQLAFEGKALFKAKCMVCNKVQKEKSVGPG
jgi:hypothetical protein